MKKLPVILFFLLILSCDKIHYYPDRPFYNVKTKILAHRAGCGLSYQGNLPDKVNHSLELVAGVEVDIQISGDRTIWISHNMKLPECESFHDDCFIESTDAKIALIDSCLGPDQGIYRLEYIFATIANSYPQKYISIDVKAWEPCNVGDLDVGGMMNVVGEEIIALTNKYDLGGRVMIESETASFLNFVKKQSSGIETYLCTWGDFERGMLICLENGFSGISFYYKYKEEITKDHIYMIRKKGLKIQLWTVNDTNDLKEAFSLNPDFIQTDEIGFASNLDELLLK
ncbi:MAG: glycerophosphodiester phosphodiesterase family protein [Salinivirgaceae bacterium]